MAGKFELAPGDAAGSLIVELFRLEAIDCAGSNSVLIAIRSKTTRLEATGMRLCDVENIIGVLERYREHTGCRGATLFECSGAEMFHSIERLQRNCAKLVQNFDMRLID